MNKRHYFILAICIFLVEVIIAKFVPSDNFIRSSLGDFLVVILVYAAMKSLLTVDAKSLAIAVFIFAAGIEIGQYFHLIDILNIENRILRIALGNTFSWHDMLMYLLGCMMIFGLDRIWFSRAKLS